MRVLTFSSSNPWESHIISIICVMILHSSIIYWFMKPKEELKLKPQILKVQMIASPIVKSISKAEPIPQKVITSQPKPKTHTPQPVKKTIAPQIRKNIAKRGLVKPKEIIKKPVLSSSQKPTLKAPPQKVREITPVDRTEQTKQFNQFTPVENNSSAPSVSSNKPSTGQHAITKPSIAAYLHNPAPHYPDMARRRRQEGIVTLNVLVSHTGAARQVSIHKSSGFSMLDESAVNTVRKWKFIPAKQGGTTLEMSVKVPIKFKLR